MFSRTAPQPPPPDPFCVLILFDKRLQALTTWASELTSLIRQKHDENHQTQEILRSSIMQKVYNLYESFIHAECLGRFFFYFDAIREQSSLTLLAVPAESMQLHFLDGCFLSLSN